METNKKEVEEKAQRCNEGYKRLWGTDHVCPITVTDVKFFPGTKKGKNSCKAFFSFEVIVNPSNKGYSFVTGTVANYPSDFGGKLGMISTHINDTAKIELSIIFEIDEKTGAKAPALG